MSSKLKLAIFLLLILLLGLTNFGSSANQSSHFTVNQIDTTSPTLNVISPILGETHSSSLPELTESRPIFIEVDLVNSGLDKVLLTITVNPEGGISSSTSDDGDSGDDGLFNDPLIIGGIVGIVALVGVGTVVMRRGN